MACETAVVASAVGGIPEVVVDGATGLLVPYDADQPGEFDRGLAAALNEVVRDPERAAAMGRAGRERAETEFAWPAIADQTVDVYRAVSTSTTQGSAGGPSRSTDSSMRPSPSG